MNSNVRTIKLSGILDGVRGNELRREINDILADGTNILLIDMKEVNFVNSSGLGSLVSAMQVVRNANAKLFVCSINDQVRMLFELTKMDRIFQNFVDQDDFNRQYLTAKE
ncbi:STAS domain-containing protein [Chlorogloeopsis fritschii PCC 9212]|uniref:Anti-sigma factor antagonist n=1 Tax=Chlorogloeopsis fritschii PCC 6912 TaxID=211165 RepID=A0A3S1AD41_CHLFR|nr:STAS domain-containing protein [Chlorogloeopsis fritschii]RUR76226.1 anti-sigma factor antagonist [Chlorogloeopsis fritschii PCC 6912]